MKIRNILVPTDLSDACDKSLDYAVQLAGVFEAKIHLLHVIEMPVVSDPLPGALMWPYPSEAMMDEARQLLEDIRHRICVRTKIIVERGVPSEAILNYAKDHEVDLIVMATHGRRGFARMLVGSTTETVLRRAPCPVVAIRPEKVQQPPEAAPAAEGAQPTQPAVEASPTEAAPAQPATVDPPATSSGEAAPPGEASGRG